MIYILQFAGAGGANSFVFANNSKHILDIAALAGITILDTYWLPQFPAIIIWDR